MSQITLKNTIDDIQLFATNHNLINTVDFGDMDKVHSAKIVYPYWRLNYSNTTITDKRVIYNFQIVCADKKVHDDSDLIQKYDLTENILYEFITYFRANPIYHNVYKIELPVKIYAASSKFLDGAVASVMDLSISVDKRLCLSDINIEG
ncbi:MAG: hypothetical protein U0Y08_14970 [Bacteroidia bacterium]